MRLKSVVQSKLKAAAKSVAKPVAKKSAPKLAVKRSNAALMSGLSPRVAATLASRGAGVPTAPSSFLPPLDDPNRPHNPTQQTGGRARLRDSDPRSGLAPTGRPTEQIGGRGQDEAPLGVALARAARAVAAALDRENSKSGGKTSKPTDGDVRAETETNLV